MPEDLFFDHVEDFETYCEQAAAYTGMAERTIDYLKMKKADDIEVEMPPAIEDSNYEPRELVNLLLKSALHNFDEALETFQKNTMLEEAKGIYQSSEALNNYVLDLDFRNSEASLDSERLHEELDFYRRTVEYAGENGADLDTELFKHHEDGEIIDDESLEILPG